MLKSNLISSFPFVDSSEWVIGTTPDTCMAAKPSPLSATPRAPPPPAVPVSGVISQHNLSPAEPNSYQYPLGWIWTQDNLPKSALPSVLLISVSPSIFQAKILRTTLNSFPYHFTFKQSASPSNPSSKMSQPAHLLISPLPVSRLNQDATTQTLSWPPHFLSCSLIHLPQLDWSLKNSDLLLKGLLWLSSILG